MATILQNAQRIKAASDDIREVIDLCYEEVGDDERIEDYAPKLARLAVDDATEQVIATAARTTAGGVAIKDTIAVVDKVYGNTIVWNQLVLNGYFSLGTTYWKAVNGTMSAENNVLSFTQSADSKGYSCYCGLMSQISIKENHIYLSRVYIYSEKEIKVYFGGDANTLKANIVKANEWSLFVDFFSKTFDSDKANRYYSPTNGVVGDSIKVKENSLFDLTRMFGSGQEPSTLDDFCLKIFGKASADVTDAEWEAISAYCEPTLLSSKPKKVVSKEKSLWWNQAADGDFTKGSVASNANMKILGTASFASGYASFSAPTAAWKTGTRIDKVPSYGTTWSPIDGNKHLHIAKVRCNGSVQLQMMSVGNAYNFIIKDNVWTLLGQIKANTGKATYIQNQYAGDAWDLMFEAIFDLTQMFGEGNEPTTLNEFTQRIFGKDSDAVTDEEWASISAYNEGEELNYKLGTPFVSEIEIDPTAIVDEEGEQVFPNGLLSAGTAKDYIDLERGVAVKCIGAVRVGDLGNGQFVANHHDGLDLYYFEDISSIGIKKSNTNILCLKFQYTKITGYFYVGENKVGTWSSGSSQRLAFGKSGVGSLEAFKELLENEILQYELATPIEYPLPKRKPFYRVSNGGTEKITADGMTAPMVADIAYREAVTASEAVAMMAEASGIN